MGDPARGGEVERGAKEVPAAGGVDQDAEEGDLRRIERDPSRLDRALDAAVAEEDPQLVLLDRQLRQLANVRVGPFEENLALCRIRAGDELPPDLLAEDTHLNLHYRILPV